MPLSRGVPPGDGSGAPHIICLPSAHLQPSHTTQITDLTQYQAVDSERAPLLREMLSRHDRKQPPHAFSKPTPHSDSAKVDAICRSCQSQVFSAGLYSTLKSSQLNARDSIVIKYGVSAAEFYASVESGCKWCESLMSGVLTAAHLDYWHDHWNGSHSDGSSMQSNEQDPNVDMELSEGELDDSNEQLDDMTEMSDARESEEGLTLEYVDFKKWPGELSIQLCIKTTESTTLYAAIEVDINLHWDRDELEGLRPLPNFDGEQVVNMLFEAFASPGEFVSIWHISV